MATAGDPQVPDFISFLFSHKPKFDIYFVVGKKGRDKSERIGAVKLMLMAHSEVLRVELEDSDMAEKGDVCVEDIYPETFKIMLKYVYGHDTTAELCFDDADNMLYVAEKYMMGKLKNKLAARLMELLSPDNICSLLNNPACYTHLQLNSAINHILQYETQRVLDSPQFVGVSPETFVSILEKDGLATEEVELWRAAVKWAKYRAGSDNNNDLRKEVSKVSNHLRICTLDQNQIFQEVIPTKILNIDEVASVSLSVCQNKKQDDLVTFCNEILPRKRLQEEQNPARTVRNIALTQHTKTFNANVSNFTIITNTSAIELLPLDCEAKRSFKGIHAGATYSGNCLITITKITDSIHNTSSEPPVTVTFKKQVKFGEKFQVPLSNDGGNVRLEPNSMYVFNMKFDERQRMFNKEENTSGPSVFYANELIVLLISGQKDTPNPSYYHDFPSDHLTYKVVTTE